MKYQSVKLLHRMALLAISILPCAHGQTTNRMFVRVPFDFIVGDKKLAAGEYFVSASAADPVVLLQSTDMQSAALTLSQTVIQNNSDGRPRLLFHRYSDRYFLSQVWPDRTNTGRAVARTPEELRIAHGLRPEIATAVGSAVPSRQKTSTKTAPESNPGR